MTNPLNKIKAMYFEPTLTAFRAALIAIIETIRNMRLIHICYNKTHSRYNGIASKDPTQSESSS